MQRLAALWFHPRVPFALVAALCAALLAYAYYAEYVLRLVPCPLCMLQRLAFVALFVVCLLAAVHGSRRLWARIYAGLGALLAGLGAAIAARHVWLTTLPPDQVPACAPSLEYMLANFPLAQTLKTTLLTSGECAKIDWTFLGLSMPAWTLIWFLALGLALLLRAFGRSPQAS